MANSHSAFIGLMQRARNVKRWPLMAQFQSEMLSTHIYEASVIAHMLGVIAREVYGEDIEPDRVAAMAIFHEGSEIAGMSDIPSPVKYHDPETTQAIKKLERRFEQMLIKTLPEPLQASYEPLILQDKNDVHVRLAKAAAPTALLSVNLSGCPPQVSRTKNLNYSYILYRYSTGI